MTKPKKKCQGGLSKQNKISGSKRAEGGSPSLGLKPKKKKFVWAVTDNGFIMELYVDNIKASERADQLTKKYGKTDYRNDVEYKVKKVEIK